LRRRRGLTLCRYAGFGPTFKDHRALEHDLGQRRSGQARLDILVGVKPVVQAVEAGIGCFLAAKGSVTTEVG
jgi:hypothetical protein